MNDRRTPETNAAEPADRLMFSLIGAAHALEDRLEAALGTVGLSMAKHGVLSLLAQAGKPLTLSDLAARQACVRSNMTQLVDRLEADGLVRRVDDLTDRRVVRAELTPLGMQRETAGAAQIRHVQNEFAARLPDADRQAVLRALAGLR